MMSRFQTHIAMGRSVGPMKAAGPIVAEYRVVKIVVVVKTVRVTEYRIVRVTQSSLLDYKAAASV